LGLQELNLCYKYGSIYWSAANLVVDSGSYNEDANDGTNYGKMSTAIASIKQSGTEVALPLINEADFGFKVDKQNNRILFSLKAINGIGTEAVQTILEHRPYNSFQDFCDKLIVTKLLTNAQMIKLIKGGSFTELHNTDRTKTMRLYLENYVFKPCDNLTMSQMGKMVEMKMIPDEFDIIIRILNFKDYVLHPDGLDRLYVNPDKKVPKCGYHDRYFLLDSNSQSFFVANFSEDAVIEVKNSYYVISEKNFLKEVETKLKTFRDWMSKEETLNLYNQKLFNELWEKHASGTVPHWNMEALSYYDAEHELDGVDEKHYGIVNYFDLPEEPEPYEWYTRRINGEPRAFPKYKISRLAGTVLANDNNHHSFTLLTRYGVVTVKTNKGAYAYYNKTISQVSEENGKKKRLEESWLKRGTLLLCHGMRMGDQFFLKVYNDSIFNHTINKIVEVTDEKELIVQAERLQI